MLHTPLFELCREAGGRMVPFAGWEMAVQFEGLMAEHRAVRQRCGVFDISHMGVLTHTGSGVKDKLQGLVCLLYTSPSPRDLSTSRMPSSA